MLSRETIKILKKHQIRLNKRKSQHYLVSSSILDRIIRKAEPSVNDTILDIGAGIGTLTIPLSEMARKVVAIEQDPQIASILRERLEEKGITNVDVLEGDATRLELPPFNKVVSNLPYKISSPITFRLLEYDFDFGILMYQLEFADRMVAKPGESKYSRLSVMINLKAEAEKLFTVPKGAFLPPPRVSSAVVKLTPKKDVKLDEFMLNITRALFQHKRKKAKKALLDSYHEWAPDKKFAKEMLSRLDSELMDERPFQMESENIIQITHELKKLIKSD
ncbi:ribosomal RNA small subunit methyltransferase A [Methanobacterium sp. CWC-01]|uniref:16S rRNA (adenine(1518)-N(6)/adenine(1519)-N(6))- dimethyltransferase RsmA n=1 Tax=Methanobacterium aridiramus TaxID=2584467 RepID=UPI0025755775|nr:16S rRNA (adenine(1518)-N(6)/adenine(1519)-N(6))-dimethyltransferase RsmA [Methanobacterium sp. CWC-01]WJI09584.1 ribosomal RNA small subunit methyltransferase A [Methanobacterium sp. CWC-01]